MGKIIAIANQKGGVGKTTTAVNMACCVNEAKNRVLLVDFDPQSNASSGVGIAGEEGKTIYDVIINDKNIEECIQKTPFCDAIPADIRLAAAEQELAPMENRNIRLKSHLDLVKDSYDYIFIDCPPSLGLLTINSLSCCDTVLIPMQCEYFALEGLSQLISSVRTIKKGINSSIDIEGIILTMYDARTNLTIQVSEEVKRHFGEKVYKTVIPRNVRLSEAPSHGLPIIAYDKFSRGAEAYTAVAKEFLQRNKVKKS